MQLFALFISLDEKIVYFAWLNVSLSRNWKENSVISFSMYENKYGIAAIFGQ